MLNSGRLAVTNPELVSEKPILVFEVYLTMILEQFFLEKSPATIVVSSHICNQCAVGFLFNTVNIDTKGRVQIIKMEI